MHGAWMRSVRDDDIRRLRKNVSAWASPPSKPQIKDGAVVKDEAGKIAYVNIFEFSSREARDKFSAAVIEAVRATADGKRALGEQAGNAFRAGAS